MNKKQKVMPAPPIGPEAPPAGGPPVYCVTEPLPPIQIPPAVSDDPLKAQKQAHGWREEVIQQRYTIAHLERQLAGTEPR